MTLLGVKTEMGVLGVKTEMGVVQRSAVVLDCNGTWEELTRMSPSCGATRLKVKGLPEDILMYS
jgi:hypothetical protein